MDCMILQGAFTCFYLSAVLGCDSVTSGCGSALSVELRGSHGIEGRPAVGQGWLTVEEVAAAAAHLSDEERLRLTRLLFDNSRV